MSRILNAVPLDAVDVRIVGHPDYERDVTMDRIGLLIEGDGNIGCVKLEPDEVRRLVSRLRSTLRRFEEMQAGHAASSAPPGDYDVAIDLTCKFCDRARSFVVDGIAYCKTHAEEHGVRPTGKIT